MSKKVWIGAAVALVVASIVATWLIDRAKNHSDSKTVKIGAILPLTGSSARYGKWIQEGLDLALEQVNSVGGVNGQRLVITYEDDQAQPSIAASAMQKLATIDKV